jgi:methylenetetrahydrofolate--tRNA-(uracil-5-)-methyltransferase
VKAAVTVVGGGLAGAEAAWQAAARGVRVVLHEMRPERSTGAHRTPWLAELVCSNSLGSRLPDRAAGVLHAELRAMGSLLLREAESCAVPAGTALAVDREVFARRATEAVEASPSIRVVRGEVGEVPDGIVVLAAGPLASPALSDSLRRLAGRDHLFFYDALAPIVRGASIDRSIAFSASRFGRGGSVEGDYLNAPLDRAEYEAFVDALLGARRFPLRAFESAIDQGVDAGRGPFFEGCLPVEVLAARGRDALAFGPMRPVGLTDPRTGRRPHAVVQLRREDAAGERWNLVGFQTNLLHAEQERVFRTIPGLARAEFVRHGQMHRNTFLDAPALLRPTLQFRDDGRRFAAGQLAGVEGYAGAIATGLLAGWNAARLARGLEPVVPPPETMLGGLCRALAEGDPDRFQPVKAHFGLVPPAPAPPPRDARARAAAQAARAREAMARFVEDAGDPPAAP